MSRVAFADSEVGHGRAGRDVLRILDPMLHVARRIGEVPADDHAQRDSVEGRSDHPRRGAHVLERMAAAAAVLDEHRFASLRITADFSRGMLAKPRALVDIVVSDPDQGGDEQQCRQDREKDFSGE